MFVKPNETGQAHHQTRGVVGRRVAGRIRVSRLCRYILGGEHSREYGGLPVHSICACRLQAELADPAASFFLAEVDGKLAGYAKLMAGQPPACVVGPAPVELVRFYIDRIWQGTGLSAAFMEHCLKEAKQQGYRTMYLGVWEHNARAHGFYRKWGFVRVGEHTFQMGDDPQVDWWMMKALEE
jgi:GNAT superfamily N-acetyltransferase